MWKAQRCGEHPLGQGMMRAQGQYPQLVLVVENAGENESDLSPPRWKSSVPFCVIRKFLAYIMLSPKISGVLYTSQDLKEHILGTGQDAFPCTGS